MHPQQTSCLVLRDAVYDMYMSHGSPPLPSRHISLVNATSKLVTLFVLHFPCALVTGYDVHTSSSVTARLAGRRSYPVPKADYCPHPLYVHI